MYSPLGGKLAIMNGSTLVKAFVPLPGGGRAVYTLAGLVYYRHSDHLGSSRLATTPSRTLYSSTAYAPFGEPYAQAGTTDLSFTGQDQDTVAGMHDFLDRRFMPVQGRWLSPDPMGLDAVDPSSPQSWNRYAYVVNNPLAMLDPFGDDGCYSDPSEVCTNTGNLITGTGGGGDLMGGDSYEAFAVLTPPLWSYFTWETFWGKLPNSSDGISHPGPNKSSDGGGGGSGSSAANNGQQQQKPPQPKKPCSATDKLNAANKKAVKLFLRDMLVGEGGAFLVGCGIGAPAGAPFGGPVGVIGGCAGGGVAAASAALPLTTFVSALDASIEAYSGTFSSECD